MSRLPDGVLDATSPRQHAGLLWAGEITESGVRLLVRSDVPLVGVDTIDAEDLLVSDFRWDQELSLEVDLERSYVPFVAPPEGFVEAGLRTRGRRETIGAGDHERLLRLVTQKLASAGLAAAGELELQCFSAGVGAFGGPGRPRSIPGVTVTGRVRVTDAYALAQVCGTGLGRSKNYGFGLLRLRK